MKTKKQIHVHFMGIRGSGISYAASIAQESGYAVSGCDLANSNEYVSHLLASGVPLDHGHHPNHLGGVNLLITSPAIEDLDPNNSELNTAKTKNIPVMSWQKFVGVYLMKDKFVVAVAGTHGKGTTASMLGLMLEEAGLDPTVGVGAVVPKWGRNFRVGKSKYFVIEADEFNDNFLNYKPNVASITNIEMDHPEYFKDFESLRQSFYKFSRSLNLGRHSALILNKDNQGVTDLRFFISQKINYLKTNIHDFSLEKKEADYYLDNYLTTNKGIFFNFISNIYPEIPSGNLGKFQVPLFGKHNAANAACALATLFSFEYPSGELLEAARSALEKFTGVSRRCEVKGVFEGVTVVDDYAHHPTEIRMTLRAIKEHYPLSRVWAVFQPHMFTRTKYLFNDFVKVFKEGLAENIIITDIFPSREKDTGLINSQQLVEAIGLGSVKYIPDFDEIVKYLKRQAKNGDVVVIMGAGDVNKISSRLLIHGQISGIN